MPFHHSQKINAPIYHFINKKNISFIFLDLVNIAVSQLEIAATLYNTNPELMRSMMSNFDIASLSFKKAIFRKQKSFSDFGIKDGFYDYSTEQEIVKTSMVDGVFEEIYLANIFDKQFYINPNTLTALNDTQLNQLDKSTFETSDKIGYIRELPGNEANLKILFLRDEKYFLTERQEYKIKATIKFVDNFTSQIMDRLNYLIKIRNEIENTYKSFVGNMTNQRIINFF